MWLSGIITEPIINRSLPRKRNCSFILQRTLVPYLRDKCFCVCDGLASKTQMKARKKMKLGCGRLYLRLISELTSAEEVKYKGKCPFILISFCECNLIFIFQSHILVFWSILAFKISILFGVSLSIMHTKRIVLCFLTSIRLNNSC